jgi:N-acyl amino acid synthase of PEP-CTERM/exosortase system
MAIERMPLAATTQTGFPADVGSEENLGYVKIAPGCGAKSRVGKGRISIAGALGATQKLRCRPGKMGRFSLPQSCYWDLPIESCLLVVSIEGCAGHSGNGAGTMVQGQLSVGFHRYFEVLIADSPALREQAFRIRYQVYYEEGHFPDMDPKECPERMEHDAYDERSELIVLRHRPSGGFVGTTRLILPHPERPDLPFPIEAYVADRFDPRLIRPAELPRRHTAEISRLSILRQFSRRKGDHPPWGIGDASGGHPPADRRIFMDPVLGLFVGLVAVTVQRRISHWYAWMDPLLNRLLRRFGVELKPIGPVGEFHGRRQPHLGVVDELNGQCYRRCRPIWNLLTDQGSLLPPPGQAAGNRVQRRVA